MALLDIRGLKKTYGDVKAIQDLSMTLEKGKIVGLLGPNGAGKSTTISCISTLIDYDAGEILFDGEPIKDHQKKVRHRIGVVPQEIALYPTLKGRDNLRFFGGVYGLKGKALDEAVDRVSQIIGITERLNHRVETYSGGMKRRLNIGCALLHDPELLIMDEPTVGIDPQSRRHILDTVKKLNAERGMTVLYTSHYMEEVEDLCQEIYIMDEGKLLACGSHEALMASFGETEYLEVAFEKGDPHFLDDLRKVSGVTKVTPENGGYLLTTRDPLSTMAEVVTLAGERKIPLTHMSHQRANLETLFLQLTGKAFRD